MRNTLWKKTLGDLWEHKGRSALVIMAIALATFTLGVVLDSYSILSRELTRNFLAANPPAISYRLERFDRGLLEQLKSHPMVDKVEARRVIAGEIKIENGEWLPLQLFMLQDYNNINLDVLKPDRGSWPPELNGILIERQALSVLDGAIGDQVRIKTPSGFSAVLDISGTAHDVMLAQAGWENLVYGYISAQTLIKMGGDEHFNLLKVSLKDTGLSRQQMTPIAEQIQTWLTQKQYPVSGFSIAEPGEHPHANVTDGMFMIQKIFGVLCTLLSGVLVFNLISAILASQLPQIGVMKAIGASSGQIRGIYFRGISLLALLGLLLSVPAAFYVSRLYVDAISPNLNIDIHSYAVPVWVLLLQTAIGLCVPLLAAAIPTIRASRMTIRQTFIEYGGETRDYGTSWTERKLVSFKFLSHPVRLGIRNTFRRKGRFILTTSVVALAVAMLIATFNVAGTLDKVVVDERSSKNWDVDVRFREIYPAGEIVKLLASIPDIKIAEQYVQEKAFIVSEVDNNPGLPVQLNALQLDSTMVDLPLIDGRWLSSQEREIVVSHRVLENRPELRLGQPVDVKINDKVLSFRLVGVARVTGPISAYVSNISISSEASGGANGVFVIAEEPGKSSAEALKGSIRSAADEANILVHSNTTAWEAVAVVEDHFDIIFSLLMLLTLIIVLIAANGLILTMTTNILERTREIGVLKAVGGSNYQLIKMLFAESGVIALLGWVMGCVVTLPISYLVTYWLGVLLIEAPFPLALDYLMFGYSLPFIVTVAVIATLIPAISVMRLSVSEALIYE